MQFIGKASLATVILLLFFGVPFPNWAAATEEAEGSFAIVEGLVIDARMRQPVAQALVTLERGRTQGTLRARSREVTHSTVTDQKGRFQFAGVEPGVYTLMGAKDGYVPLSFFALELQAGKRIKRDVPLDPMAKISGRVVDHNDHGIKGAKVAVIVRVLQPSTALSWLLAERGLSVLTTTSDSQGKFELFVPAQEGKIALLAGALGHAPSRVEVPQVEPGRKGKDIVMRLPRGLEVRGRVVDARSVPVSGATIVARSLDPGREGLGLEATDPRGTSGENGSFLLQGLEKGTYALKVSHAAHATRTVPELKVDSATKQVPEIVLQPQAEISGRVTDTAGQPIAGAIVSGGRAGEESSTMVLSDGDGKFVLGQFSSGESVVLFAEAPGYVRGEEIVTAPQTDVVLVVRPHGVLRGRVEDFDTRGPVGEFQIWANRGPGEKSFRSEDGTFEWQGLPPGRWTFVAQAPGYQNAAIHDVDIRPGEPMEGVVFVLRRGVDLAGRVVDDETGEPLPDVIVAYRDASEPEDPAWLRFTRTKQTTDAEGNFKFEGVPPVKVEVIAYSPLYAEARSTVRAGEEDFAEIRLGKGASLSGRVVTSNRIAPIAGALVSLGDITGGSGTTILTDVGGAFSFDRLSAGHYQLKAESDNGQTQPLDIVLRENEHVAGLTLVIKPEATTTIRGKVTGVLPNELPVVQVVANGRSGFSAYTSTDAEGAYIIRRVPTGVVRLMATATPSFRSIRKSIEIREGVQELTLDIEFPPPARLYGRVTRAGQSVFHATVVASPVDPQLPRASKETDQDGMYSIDGLSDGDYVVRVAGEEARKSVRISHDTLLDIELPPSSISGRVVGVNSGEALAGASVQVRAVGQAGNSGGQRTVVSDALGRFSIEGIVPGNYQIVAHKPGFSVSTQTVSVSVSSGPIDLTIFLTPAEGIEIRVRDGVSGLGLRSVAVSVFSGPVLLRMDVGLDETGRGELPQLPPGGYSVFLSTQGYASKSVIGWTVPGSGLDVFLTPGGRLEIQVDSAYIGATARLLDANGIAYPPTVSDPSFALSQATVFRHLSPGQYSLSVRLPSETKTYTAAVFEGQTTILHVK